MADLKALKTLIDAMESSGGQDIDHRSIKSGIHRGTAAVGESGLMPETARLMAKRNIRDNKASELDKLIAATSVGGIPQILKDNLDKYQEYRDALIKQVNASSQGDPVDAYTRWLHGQAIGNDRLKTLQATHPGIEEKVNQRIEENALSSQPDNYTDQFLKDVPKEQLYSKIKQIIGNK